MVDAAELYKQCLFIGLRGKEKDEKWLDEDNKKNIGTFDDSWKEKTILPQLKGKKVLDIACNVGKLCKPIMATGCEYYGTDLSQFIINLAREQNPGGNFLQASAYEIPFKENFDTIIASDIVEHLESPIDAMRSWLGHLNIGGRLIVITPNALCARKLILVSRGLPIPTEPEAHINMFTFWSLGMMMGSLGLNVTPIPLEDEPRLCEMLLFVGDKR